MTDELRKEILGEHKSVIKTGLMHGVCDLTRQHACMIKLQGGDVALVIFWGG